MVNWCWVMSGCVGLSLAFAGCSSEKSTGGGAGSGGTAGTSVTCPPTLVAPDGAATIPCDSPGELCNDPERQCLCGDPQADCQVWLCVPLNAGCPSAEVHDGDECDAATQSSTCSYVESGIRSACNCRGSTWSCVVSLCGYTLPTTGSACTEVA